MVVGMPLPAVDTDCMLAEAGVPEAAELPVGEVGSVVEAAAVQVPQVQLPAQPSTQAQPSQNAGPPEQLVI